ncbi:MULTISPECIES: hypothetical protein [Shewanella]|uniref:MipA/OmpV family protein n=1 Tax=Shewanella marisflavi TaxID=260364 RepID=A0ABX5WRR4_9GAMM|nr:MULTISPECIES: hypothetical protein [Shewanella]MCL1043388.1 hypothetical protein [Shewanella marisflavi]QDF76939.1 hypothetical protein FGA12_18185 [Shewanella marisflavi]
MNKLLTHTCILSLMLAGTVNAAEEANTGTIDDSHINNIISHGEGPETSVILDLGWDSKYISEGRNNLDKGGIYWATAAVQLDDLTLFTTVGRGDSQYYIEWNMGLEYGFELRDNLSAAIGYQRIETYSDERSGDNEFFATIEYTALEWLTPSVSYTYSTEAAGYFVEVSLHSEWPISEKLTLTPYVTQAFDFQYVTEEHNGPNHFQFGLEAQYQLANRLVLSGHLSRTLAQEDIKQENPDATASLNNTYAGLHLTFSF